MLSLLSALLLAATPYEPPVDLDAEVEAIRSGGVDMLDYDYGRLRFHPDRQAAWAAMDAVERYASTLIELPEGIRGTGRPFSSCLAGEQANAMLMGVRAAKLTPDAESWRSAYAHTNRVIAETEADLAARLAAGEASASDPVIDELKRHYAADRAWRSALSALPENPGSHDREVVTARVLPRICGVDAASTAFMKDALARIDWFTIGEYGEETDRMAWLLIQHTNDDDFQAEVLSRLERLAPQGQTSGRNYAMLHDRVAVRAGRLQRYGTQGICMGGRWIPTEMEDREHVETRREALGLEPLPELAARHASACG